LVLLSKEIRLKTKKEQDMYPRFEELEEIFMAGVRQVDPYRLVSDALHVSKSRLSVSTNPGLPAMDLEGIDNLYVIGAGKATARMARAVEDLLGSHISGGVIAVKYGHTEPLDHIETIEAGHPLPDENGVRAARAIAELAARADEKSLVLNLISGGGSALLPWPLDFRCKAGNLVFTLEEKQAITALLLSCGAEIDEINCIRKHLSMIKGGKLARMLHPARSLSLILSDVVGDHLDVIASGPTTFDRSTWSDVQRIIDRYDLGKQVSTRFRRAIRLGVDGILPETPKPADPVFDKVDNLLIGTNRIGLLAARDAAASRGFTPVVLSSRLTGEAREVAKVLCAIAAEARLHEDLGKRPLCVLAGGETTVTIRGKGKGGRNQEMALAVLNLMRQRPEELEGVWFLSGATDGNDGPTDAAGAFAAGHLLPMAAKRGLDPEAFLKNNDAYAFYEAMGHLLKTGPTNTNVCDYQVMIVE
jgi:glycerate 2-kinase